MSTAALITRLEKATEPDRELDLAIYNRDVRPRWYWIDQYKVAITRHQYGAGAVGNPVCSLEYLTASIDDALTLLPDFASYELTRSAAGEPTFTRCRLWDWRRAPTGSDPGNEWKSEGNRPLPVNIIIAALKMREAARG